MSRAAKRKVQRTNDAMTTEQLVMKATKDVKRMSPDEKAKLHHRLDKEFKRVPRVKNMDGYADAVRGCAAEEAAMLKYDEKGKSVTRVTKDSRRY
jgi:hypothetical protein